MPLGDAMQVASSKMTRLRPLPRRLRPLVSAFLRDWTVACLRLLYAYAAGLTNLLLHCRPAGRDSSAAAAGLLT